VFSPTIHKFDDTNAGILADNVMEESPILDCFELFLLTDAMNIIANETNKFYIYVTNKIT
jgi:hypothetical protein